ncbi:serine hydrolase domain-containing protein [Candidatus Dormiibacter inghamiae]|uniref:serine hydrolase domain-containing protein n=1 Tax=Candidatus Dormiibacter inghamiae TaxID=3127013 RepID=UPI0030C75C90
MAACASPIGSPGPSVSPRPSPSGLPLASKAGVDQIAGAALSAEGAGLSIAVERGGQAVFAKGYGWADIENRVPVTVNSIFGLASVTKQFTAAAIMQMVEQGKFHLDDYLSKLLPEFPDQSPPVTVRQLLNHTSGIAGYTSLPGYLQLEPYDQSEQTMISFIASSPRKFAPGSRFGYSNSGYFLLGLLLERQSGSPYATYLQQHLFKPLGLHDTEFCQSHPDGRREVRRYAAGGSSPQPAAPVSMTVAFSAGGLCSTPEDMLRWQDALRAGRVVSKATYRLMTTPTLAGDGQTTPYGFGLEFDSIVGGQAVVWHDGGGPGISSELAYYPNLNLGVAVVSNADRVSATVVAQAVAEFLIEPTRRPSP